MIKMGKIIIIVLLFLLFNSCSFEKGILITAHRGASAYAPENTIASIKMAIDMKADYSEIDVQETLDGQIILLHDKTLERTTNENISIWNVTYKEIKDLDAGSWFEEKYGEEKIPTLKGVLELVQNKIKLNIELKTNGHEKKLAERVVELVHENNFSEQCIFTSFDYRQIERVKELDPNMKVGLIFSQYPKDFDVFKAPIEILSVHHRIVNEEFMRKAKIYGKEVHVWTVNDSSLMTEMINLGVSSLITNYPDKAKHLLSQ